MIYNLSPEEERRIYNIIWNGSREYKYEPSFVGLDISGDPDFYMSLVIGLVYRYFGKDQINSLMDSWSNSRKRDVFDNLAWLALENLIFKKEEGQRENMLNLRRDYAKNFQSPEKDLNRRRLALSNNLVYRLYDCHTKAILDMSSPKLSCKEAKLLGNLLSIEAENSEELEKALNSIFTGYFSNYIVGINEKGKLEKRLFNGLEKISTGQIEYSQRPNTGQGINGNSYFQNIILGYKSRSLRKKEEEIEAIFGKSIFNSKERLIIDEKYCKDGHDKCHLWFSKGEDPKSRFSRERQTILDNIKRQQEKNLRKYNKLSSVYNREIINLTNRINRLLDLSQSGFYEVSKKGKIIPGLAWKSLLPKEEEIFYKTSVQDIGGFRVDLLLDASASRLDNQGEIAIQAYIISKSLENCHIPVRVISYNTLFDYTCFTILKDIEEDADINKILAYYPMGWNRDGLAYRGYRQLLPKQIDKQLCILLTDAKPNDLVKFNDKLFSSSYEGKKAIEDTGIALNNLRKEGIDIAAMVTESEVEPRIMDLLFRKNFVKVSTAAQISSVGGRFIQNQIEALSRL